MSMNGMLSRVDKYTDHFEMKEVHGQLVNVRVLKPHKPDGTPSKVKRLRKNKFCRFCETEVFDAGKECDLCGGEF